MSGGSFTFKVADGRVAYYCNEFITGNAKIGALLLITTGLDADDVLADFTTISAVLGGNTEASAAGYSRDTDITPTVTNGTAAPGDLGGVSLTLADASFGTPAATETAAKLIVFVDNDTTSGNDTNLIPLMGFSFDKVFDGNALVGAFPDPLWSAADA